MVTSHPKVAFNTAKMGLLRQHAAAANPAAATLFRQTAQTSTASMVCGSLPLAAMNALQSHSVVKRMLMLLLEVVIPLVDKRDWDQVRAARILLRHRCWT